jgi:hypothetical protein
VLPGATALYRDKKGTPAVIVKPHSQGRTIYLNAVITDYHRWRMRPPEGESLRRLVEELLGEAGVARQYEITRSDGTPAPGVEIHPWRSGDLRILGIHRNYGLRISELGPTEYQNQAALEAPMELTLKFGTEMSLYDALQGKPLGRRNQYTFKLDKIQPAILALTPAKLSPPAILAPAEASRGTLLKVPLRVEGESAEAAHALRVRLLGPDNRELAELTRNLKAIGGKALWELPLAANLPEGRYALEVIDVPTGGRSARPLLVR